MLLPRKLSVETFDVVLPRKKDGVLTYETYQGRRRFNHEFCRIDFVYPPLNLQMSEGEFNRLHLDLQDLITPFAGCGDISIMFGYWKEQLPPKYHDWLFMHNLYVDRDHRRMGLGSIINYERKRFAGKLGRPVLLKPDPETSIGFFNLIQFNEKNGFHELEDAKGFWGCDRIGDKK